MGNSKDQTKRNTNSAGESRQLRPDPIVQARDDCSRPHKGMQPTEIVHSAEKPVSIAGATLLASQFMGPGEPTQAAPSAVRLLASIWRLKWTITAVFVMVAAPAIAAIWTQMILKYRAKAEVRVRPIIPYLVFRTEDSGMIPLYASFLNTQVSVIRSSAVLQRALDKQEVQETQWYKNARGSLKQRLLGKQAAPPMERLRDALSVGPRRRTEIIDVSFVDPSAKDAKIIVDAVLDQYTEYVRDTSDAAKDELYRQLVDQYTSLKNEIEGREKFSAGLRKSLRTGLPEELVSRKRAHLDGIQVRLSELQQTIAILEWELKQATVDDSNDVQVRTIGEMEKQHLYHEDAEWRRLDLNVRTMRHQIANSIYRPNHPEMAKLTEDMEFAGTLLRQRESQLDEQWRNRLKNVARVPITTSDPNSPFYTEEGISLEHQLARTKQQEKLLLAELDKQQAAFEPLFEKAQLLKEENDALLHRRELFGAVRQRLDQKNMERNVRGSIEVLTWASAPSEPDNDRRIVFTAMALVMGLVMGSGVAFLRARRNQIIYTSEDMPHLMQVPFLGHIPVTRVRKSIGRSLFDELPRIRSHKIESLRIVRTALLSRLEGQGSTTVLVTSAAGGTGKSSFTMMLGKSLARAGKKVLMIDADLRKMTLTKRFGLRDESGFMESLRRGSIDKRHIFLTETSRLSIMPAGKLSEEGVVFEETANGAFKACIDQLRKQYSIILLDCSPILPLADAVILSAQVDGTIMVERELVSRRANVIDALVRLGSAGGRLLGTVFVGSGGREDYGYRDYGRTGKL